MRWQRGVKCQWDGEKYFADTDVRAQQLNKNCQDSGAETRLPVAGSSTYWARLLERQLYDDRLLMKTHLI